MSKFDFNIDNYTKEELLDFFFDSDDESIDVDNYKIKSKADKLRKPYCVNKVIILTIQGDEIAEALASRRKR